MIFLLKMLLESPDQLSPDARSVVFGFRSLHKCDVKALEVVLINYGYGVTSWIKEIG